MSAWLPPAAAMVLWVGILASEPAARLRIPWGAGLACAALVMGVALGLARSRTEEAGPLHAAGLIEERLGPAVVAIGPQRLMGGRGPPWLAGVLVLLAFLVAGVGLGGLHRARVDASALARLAPQRGVEMEGSLRTDPRRARLGWWAVLDVSSVALGAQRLTLREPVWVSGDGETPTAVRGDVVRLVGALTRPEADAFGTSLARRGIGVTLRTSEVSRVGPSANPLVRAAQVVRDLLGRRIQELFPPREAGLLLGLALGDDSRLDREVEGDFRVTGLGHLLVVSGSNVAMVLAPVLLLCMLLRLRAAVRLGVGLATVAFFVVLTGLEPSVLRAGLMAGLAMVGAFLGRPRTSGALLGGAVLLLLLADPALAWAVAFQLSVAATAGMVLMAGPMSERLRIMPRPVALAAAATLAAQVGVAPVLLFHFRELPTVTLLANVVAFPAVSPALLVGLAAAGAGAIWRGLGSVLAALAMFPLRYLELVADRLARSPLPWVTSGGGLTVLVAGAAVVGALAWWLRSGCRRSRMAMVLLAAVLPFLAWSRALSAGPPAGLVVRFLDVGQGDAALVTSPGGASILVDGGPDPLLVARKLVGLGVRRLDAVVATHPHADHVEGLPAVLARLPVGALLEPGCDESTPSYEALRDAVRDEGIRVLHPRTGDVLAVGDLRLEVLSPAACYRGTESDPNNDSLVIRLSYREDVLLLAGDAEEPAQEDLMEAGIDLAADVLKVPHHGGATSLAAFFAAVDPEVAVVSTGPNEYGHPVPEVLAALRATGAGVIRTDLAGDVTVTFAPGGLLVASAAS